VLEEISEDQPQTTDVSNVPPTTDGNQDSQI